MGEKVLIVNKSYERNRKLGAPQRGPYVIVQVNRNGTVVIERNKYYETINIRRGLTTMGRTTTGFTAGRPYDPFSKFFFKTFLFFVLFGIPLFLIPCEHFSKKNFSTGTGTGTSTTQYQY